MGVFDFYFVSGLWDSPFGFVWMFANILVPFAAMVCGILAFYLRFNSVMRGDLLRELVISRLDGLDYLKFLASPIVHVSRIVNFVMVLMFLGTILLFPPSGSIPLFHRGGTVYCFAVYLLLMIPFRFLIVHVSLQYGAALASRSLLIGGPGFQSALGSMREGFGFCVGTYPIVIVLAIIAELGGLFFLNLTIFPIVFFLPVIYMMIQKELILQWVEDGFAWWWFQHQYEVFWMPEKVTTLFREIFLLGLWRDPLVWEEPDIIEE